MSEQLFQDVARRIDGYKDYAIEMERRLTAVPALDPDAGGDGEAKKAEVVLAALAELGIEDVQVYKCPDERVSVGYRPSIAARIAGQDTSRTLWIMAHMDVVPAGDLKTWDSDPWEVRVEGDKIYGRGVEDNQQGLVSGLCLARAIKEQGATPPYNLGLLFVADEETGNQYGIQYLLEEHEIFKADDIIVVPDGGEPDGSMIEVAEKGIVWFKISVKGKQTHGSTPDRGVNAHLAAARLIVRLQDLYTTFDLRDEVYDPPTSTFEATKVEGCVPNVNTIPGEHVFYMDCRVMPEYELDRVCEAVEAMAAEVDAAAGTSTTVELNQRQDAAPPTAVDAPVVGLLAGAVKAVYGVQARPMGIGGGTVAAFIRRKGYSAAVWSSMDETMHGPNEYSVLSNLLGDAKVLAHVLFVS